MNRIIRLEFLLLFLVAACGPRNIDYTKGVGPQGGQSQGGVAETVAVELVMRSDYSVDPWFSMKSNFGYDSRSVWFQLDRSTSQLSDGRSLIGGSYECLSPSRETPIALCEEFSLVIPPLWLSYPRQGLPTASIHARVFKPEPCTLRGQFPWESELQVWATGKLNRFRSVEALGESKDYVMVEAFNQITLKTHASLIDETTRVENGHSYFSDDLQPTALEMQFPVRSFDNRRVRISDRLFPLVFFESSTAGVSTTTIEFIEVETRNVIPVKLEFSCAPNAAFLRRGR
jgi:hypothetical protein